MERRVLGIEPSMATICVSYGAMDVIARHARICPRAGIQVKQHQPLFHALAALFKRPGRKTTVEDGDAFTTNRDYRGDIVVSAREVEDTFNHNYAEKTLLIDVTHALAGDVQRGSATIDDSAATTSQMRKNAHYDREGQIPCDQWSFKFAALTTESFGRLGNSGEKLLDRGASIVVEDQGRIGYPKTPFF